MEVAGNTIYILYSIGSLQKWNRDNENVSIRNCCFTVSMNGGDTDETGNR